MILIVDNTHRKMCAEIRRSLLHDGIPCVVCDVDHCDEYMPIPLTIVTERYIMEDVDYISGFHGNPKAVLYDESVDFEDFVRNSFQSVYGDVYKKSKISRVKTTGDQLLFCGRPIHLTPVEKRILNLLQYAPRWYDRKEIANYCLSKGKNAAPSVNVHVCNMNTKANNIAGENIIECRRYSGYRLNMF